MSTYIYHNTDWPEFRWDTDKLAGLLALVRNRQGKLLGRMDSLGFHLQSEAILTTLSLDIIKSNEIEGEMLNPAQVRSSLARRLGMEIAGLVPSDRHVDGVVEMMLDATRKYKDALTDDRLFGWHSAMFPSGRSGLYKIRTGYWRTDVMQVVSGGMGNEKVHFEAPAPESIDKEMKLFFAWFNSETKIDAVIKAAVAHLWFVTIHPFEDGNGRIGRAIMDMQLARADESHQRFYSMSAQIQKERNAYYEILERSQRGDLNITPWIEWFLSCLDRALAATDEIMELVFRKSGFWKLHGNAGLNARQTLMLNKMLDGFEGKMTAAKWGKIAKCSHDTALRDIQNLLERNILIKEEAGGRSTAYILGTIITNVSIN